MNLDTALTICGTLEDVLQPMFGPRGLKSMVTTATGKILVTSDGATVLQALNLSHPLAKLILKSANQSSCFTGGGCKTFVLYVCGALEAVKRESIKHANLSTWDDKVLQMFGVKLSHSLLKLVYNHISKDLEDKLQNHRIHTSPRFYEEWQSVLSNLIHTELAPHFTSTMTDFFTKILSKFLQIGAESAKNVVDNAHVIDSNFEQICVKVNGVPYTESSISEKVLIQRDFCAFPAKVSTDIKFIVVRSTVDGIDQENSDGHKVELKEQALLESSLDQKQQKAADLLKVCQDLGINLVISTEKMLQSFVYLCRQNNIGLVEYIHNDDANRLTWLCQKQPVHRVTDISESNICQATTMRRVQHGGKPFIELGVCEPLSPVLAGHIVVCAPADGLCDDAKLVLHKAVKVVAQSTIKAGSNYLSIGHNNETAKCQDYRVNYDMTTPNADCKTAEEFTFLPDSEFDGNAVNAPSNKGSKKEAQSTGSLMTSKSPTDMALWGVLPGGGTFEHFVQSYMDDLIQHSGDDTFASSCGVVKAAAGKIPQAIQKNSSNVSPRAILEAKLDVQTLLNAGQVPGINCYSGKVELLHNILEPVTVKVSNLIKAMLVVCQILRTDSIIGVKSFQTQ